MNTHIVLAIRLGFIVFFLTLVSCQQSKTSSTVFPDQSSYSAACSSSAISNRYIVKWEDGTYSVETTEDGTTDEDFRKDFVDRNLDKIKYVDRDHKVFIRQSVENLTQNATQSDNWGAYKIEANEVWNQNITGENVLVGVVDGMVDSTHVQLSDAVTSNEQFNSEVNDSSLNIHGTHVAGIIAANPDNGPVNGIAPGAKIIAGQFIDNSGGGSLGDAILALNSVGSKGVQIINISWGGAPCVENLRSVLNDLSNQGILLVTAAGNESTNLDESPNFPAAFGFQNQINVAASTSGDGIAYFSNRGVYTVQVAAPGVNIYSTIPQNNYELMDGTSMAAPLVSGVAALLFSAYPNATAQDVKSAILNSVDVNASLTSIASKGRVNARKALAALKSMLSSN